MAPCKQSIFESELAIHVSTHRIYARRREFQEPANICGSDKMPSWPHDVRAKDGPFVECLLNQRVGRIVQAQPERPLCARVILCLHRAEPGYDLLGFRQTVPREPLLL